MNYGLTGSSFLEDILAKSYTASSTQVFKYGAEGKTAAELTLDMAKHSKTVSKVLTQANIVTNVITSAYSGYKIYEAANDPNKDIETRDVVDLTVGVVSTGTSIWAVVATASAFTNPVGWAVLIGSAAWYIGSAIYYDD